MRSQHLGHFPRALEHEMKALLDGEASEKIELEGEFEIVVRVGRRELQNSRGMN